MNTNIYDLLAAELGDAVSHRPGTLPRVAPTSSNGIAATLGLADRHGWRVRIEGAGTWMPADGPGDLVLTTARLDHLVSVSPADLVATVQAGMPMRRLAGRLAQHRTRFAVDPPGAPDRSLGGVLATGTGGGWIHRFGPVRDQVLGTTVATADGRLIRSGGNVVKNVAGFDLPKLQVGGYGAFGVITEINIRLRSVPAVTRVLTTAGALDPLFHAGRALVTGNTDATMIEMLSPLVTGRPDWVLVVELTGTADGVAAEMARVSTLLAEAGHSVAEGGRMSFAESSLEGPVTVRAGALPTSMPDTVDLFTDRLGAGRMTFGLSRGGLRWTGPAEVQPLLDLRTALAEREIPLTLERAPWPIRSAVGHFGAYRIGVGALSARVRDVFDPNRILMAPLEQLRSE